MEHTKVGHAQRQLAPGSVTVIEDKTMSGTVHRLEGKLLLLCFKGEHVLGIVLPMAGGHPQLGIVDVGRNDFLETALPVLRLDEAYQSIVDVSSSRLEKA